MSVKRNLDFFVMAGQHTSLVPLYEASVLVLCYDNFL